MSVKRASNSLNDSRYLSGISFEMFSTITSKVAMGMSCDPFHSHSTVPPPSRIGVCTSLGVAARIDKASMKLDFPEAFGPIRTFKGSSSSGGVEGPKERMFSSWTLRTSLLPSIVLSSLFIFPLKRYQKYAQGVRWNAFTTLPLWNCKLQRMQARLFTSWELPQVDPNSSTVFANLPHGLCKTIHRSVTSCRSLAATMHTMKTKGSLLVVSFHSEKISFSLCLTGQHQFTGAC